MTRRAALAAVDPPWQKRTMAERKMTDGQRAYEAKRAAKAGMSLDKWLDTKQRQAHAEARAVAVAQPKPEKKPGFLARLIERAHRPLGR